MGEIDSQNETQGVPTGGRLCPQCGARFDPHIETCPQDGAELFASGEKEPYVGKTIAGKYKILSMVGKGGMSVVYKAEQLPIDKIVAVKMLLAHLSHDNDAVRRFYHEAKAAARLSHPNVVGVFDYGMTEDGQPYLVMDYVEGVSLSQVISRQGRMTYQRAVPLFIQICDGLETAHQNGIVHRDIKPGNIVLQDVNESEMARLVDFGIAKMIDNDAQHLTKTGEVFGSPLYMSPEQCEGRTLDARSDMYSLGVVFYEVLAGSPPLMGSTAIETMRLHLQEMPLSLQKMVGQGQIPLALENIIFKMMAKDADKRYGSIVEVKRELENFIQGQTGALSGRVGYVSREISRRSKIIGISALVAVFVYAVGFAVYPSICNFMYDTELEQGRRYLKSRDFGQARRHIESAVAWTNRSGNTEQESKALRYLVEIYRDTGEFELARAAKKRRQGIIKANLRDLGVADSEIMLAMKNAPGVPLDAPAGGRSDPYEDDDGGTDALSGDKGVSKKFSAARDEQEAAGGGGGAAVADSKKSLGKSEIVQARERQGAMQANRQSVDSGKGAGAGADVPIPASRPLPSLSPSSPVSSSTSFSGGTIVPPLSPYERLMAIEAEPDRLDRIQASTELLIEMKEFAKAENGANVAVAMHRKLYGDNQSGLSHLYLDRAWARLNQGKTSAAENDLSVALSLAKQTKSPAEEAEAHAMLAVIHSGNKKHRDAAECFSRSCKLVDGGADREFLFSMALDRYASELEKNGDGDAARRVRAYVR